MTGAAPLNRLLTERNGYFFSLTIFLFFFLYRLLVIFFPHPDAGGVEGNVVYFIQRILDNQFLYTDPEQTPYAIAQYPPFYYYLVAGTAKLFGVGADDVFAVFITGRIVSLLLNIGLLAVVYTTCRNIFSVSKYRSTVAAVAAFIFLEITSFARPDSLYHLFFMLSLYYFLKHIGKQNSTGNEKTLIIAAILAAITLFSKQTGIVLPFIFGSWFLVKGKYKALILFIVVFLGITGLILAGISYSTGLELFYKNAILGINNGISIGWYRQVVFMPLYTGFGLIFLLGFLIILLFLRKEKSNLLRCSGFILIMLFVLLNLAALKLGSGPGYLTEWWTFLFILLAYYWPQMGKRPASISYIIPVFILSATLIIKLIVLAPSFNEKTKAFTSGSRMTWYETERKEAESIKKRLLPGDKYVVFTNLYTPDSYMSNLLFRHAVVPQMEIFTLSTYPMKKYDYAGFEAGLKDGRFKWMLMKEKDTSRQFFNTRLDAYQLQETMGGYNLYQFKP